MVWNGHDVVDSEMFLAATTGHVDKLQTLLRCSRCNGAGVPTPTRRHSCSRLVSIFRSTPGLCRDCSGSGVMAPSVDAKNTFGNTALFGAARNGFSSCVEMLLGARACPNFENFDEHNTPLIRAAAGGHGSCVSLLLEASSRVNAMNKHGHTALLLAAQAGYRDCVQMLLDSGAHVEAKGDEGHTALIRAAQAGHQDCVDVLRNAGACANVRGGDGVNATRWAERRGHVQIAQALAGRVLTVHISIPEDADDPVTVVVTDIQGEELASVTSDSAQPLKRFRSLLDVELAGQSYTLVLPSGHVLTAEDDERTIANLHEDSLHEDVCCASLV